MSGGGLGRGVLEASRGAHAACLHTHCICMPHIPHPAHGLTLLTAFSKAWTSSRCRKFSTCSALGHHDVISNPVPSLPDTKCPQVCTTPQQRCISPVQPHHSCVCRRLTLSATPSRTYDSCKWRASPLISCYLPQMTTAHLVSHPWQIGAGGLYNSLPLLQ